MLLKDVLAVFDDELNEAIENICYEERDAYEVELVYYDKDCLDGSDDYIGSCYMANVVLFSDGNIYTKFKVIDDNSYDGYLYVHDELLRLIQKVKEQWGNYIASNRKS